MNTSTITNNINESEVEVALDESRRGPIRRVVVGSLATGFVGAAVLTLVVFAGAQEHVITGSALLAFACGWAMLAGLSRRMTNQPQTWAFVPGTFMAVAGISLVVFSPGESALNASGWVWPPALLAIVVWTVVQMRRALAGRVRWLLYPVVAALALGSVGGFFETIAVSRAKDSYPAPGEMYDVGGYRLHLNCFGSGTPTVVLENGLGGTSPLWSRITAHVSSTTRICAYDRAGQGWSDDAPSPQDGFAVAADLHTLLEVAGEAGPYVIVGHSTGGVYSMIYAAQYPDEVVGMVLLDSSTPYQFTALPDFEGEYSMMRMMLGVMPSIARLGATQLLPASAYSSLPEPAASQVRALVTSPRQNRGVRDEATGLRSVFEQGKSLETLHDKPLVVVTATETANDTNGWSAAQAELAMLSTNSQHRVVEATHEGVLDDPASFQQSADAIVDVITAVRSGERVVNR